MPLNILLADDSVPAQNMGKKILVDAGYGVVTVSNGLEALRKIAEAVPDMAILDIFMPGYTGLEICKRLRSSAATATVPVILTVGKLEPYRPEDGEQVQSNAVIVKPFSATELISAVRSLIGGPLAETQTSPGLEAKSQPESAVAGDPEPPAGAFQEEEPDEPIFANAASGIGGDDLFYSGEFLLSGANPNASDPNGAASLAFDPDAKPTPFSASAIETPSPASHAAAGNGASAFGEFDLEKKSSAYPAAEPETSPVAEPSLPSSPTHEVPVHEVPLHEFPVEATHEDGLVADGGLDAPALDPLPEPLEASGSTCVSEPSIPGDDGAVQLSPEEEARIAAFEALFNSPEPLPLDNVAAPRAETASVAFDSITPNLDVPNQDAPNENACEIEPEPEIAPEAEIGAMADDRQEHLAEPFATPFAAPFATQELDPNPLNPAQHSLEEPEIEPLSAIDAIPDPLPDLLDEALAPAEWPEPATFCRDSASRAGALAGGVAGLS